MEVIEIVNEASAAFVEKQYHTACYKYKAALQLLSRLNGNSGDNDQFVIQYALCITLLESGTLHNILQALETLTELEKSIGNSFPAVYYALGKAYIKLYRFDSAMEAINKGYAILNAGIHFKEFYIPMTSLIIKESTKEGLLIALMNLHDEASRWRCPDAKCYIEDCQNYVPYCSSCRDIYFSDPSCTGLIIVTCSNMNNPCKLKFHPVCWNFQKEKLCSVLKLSDKELIGHLCFSLNCTSNNSMSIIKKIEIFNSNGEVASVIENSSPVKQPTPDSPIKGAIKKYPPQPFPKLRRPNLPCRFPPQPICDKEEPKKEDIEIDTRLAKLIKLRETNFNAPHGQNLGLDKDKHENEYLDSTTNILPDLTFSDNDVETMQQCRFLFEILHEFIKSNLMVHTDKVLLKWHETKGIMEYVTAIDEYLDSDIMELLLKSPKLMKIGNYICIPETLQQTLQIFEHEIIQQCKFVLQVETHKASVDSHLAANELISHKEIATTFENQTGQTPPKLSYSTNNVNENNNEDNNNICQNFDMCESFINSLKSNSPIDGKTNNLSKTKDTFDWIIEHTHNLFTKNNPLPNGDMQISDKENKDKKYCDTSYKDKSFNNCNDIKRNNEDFTDSMIHEDNSQNSIKNPFLKENVTKNTLEDNLIKQLTNDKLSSNLITLQEKYTQLMTNYFMMEQNMAKLLKEKVDMEQNFKLELEKKNSIMEAVIEERKILIKKLEAYELRIAEDIPAKCKALNKNILILQSEMSQLKQEKVYNEHNMKLLLEEKNVAENTLKKQNTELLETIKHCQAERDKKNAELITFQENNLELKKCMLQKSLESQFLYNQSILFQGLKHCQVAVEIFNSLNYMTERNIGFTIMPNYTVWLEALNRFQTLFKTMEEEYFKLKSLLESKAEVEKVDKIVMNSINLPPYPGRSLSTTICDAFMIFYTHVTKFPQHGFPMVASPPLLLNPLPFIQQPILQNKTNLQQFSNENKAANSIKSYCNMTQIINELEKKHMKDNYQNISQKPDLSKQNNKDIQKDLQHTDKNEKVQCKLKDNENDIDNKIKEYIKDNNEIVTEVKTSEASATNITNGDVSNTFNENKSVSKMNGVSNNVDCTLLSEGKVEEIMEEENIKNAEQKNNHILVNSTDKVMNIMRNRYTGMSDLLLLKSLDDVRILNNGSLTGMPLDTVLQNVDKHVLLYQLEHLCTYVESKKNINNSTTVLKGNKKQSKNKVKKKSSNNPTKLGPLKDVTLIKSSVESQKGQHESISSTSSGAVKKESISVTKCPWEIILQPGTNKNNYEESECVICMENLQTASKLVYTLDCQHKFHKTCIKEWFQQNQSCPTCRIHCTIDEEYPPLP